MVSNYIQTIAATVGECSQEEWMARKLCLLAVREMTSDYLVLGDKRGEGVVKPRDIGSLVYCYAEMLKASRQLQQAQESLQIKKALAADEQ